MASPKASNSPSDTKRKVLTIEFKKNVIAKREAGIRVSDIANEFGLAKSTISTILRQKELLKASESLKGSNLPRRFRLPMLEEVVKPPPPPPKKTTNTGPSEGNIRRKVLTVEFKKELIAKHEAGIRVSDLAKEFGIASSTISTILKHKEMLKAVNVVKGTTVLSKHRPQVLEEVEKLLVTYMKDTLLNGDLLTDSVICAKAREIYYEFKLKHPHMIPDGYDFKASKGWFKKFKRRSGVYPSEEDAEEMENYMGQSLGLEIGSEDLQVMLEEEESEFDMNDYQHHLLQEKHNTRLMQKETPHNIQEELPHEVEEEMHHGVEEEVHHGAEEEVQSEVDEEKAKWDVPTQYLKEICDKWNEILTFVELHHPDQATASKATCIFNDVVMNHFQSLLASRQEQAVKNHEGSECKREPAGESSKANVCATGYPNQNLLENIKLENSAP